jgi:hypothetical protein
VFDREGEVAGQGGQVEREVGGDLAAVHEHLGAVAYRGGYGADADLAGSRRGYGLPAQLGGAGRGEPDSAGLEGAVRGPVGAHRGSSGYSTRLSSTRSTP